MVPKYIELQVPFQLETGSIPTQDRFQSHLRQLGKKSKKSWLSQVFKLSAVFFLFSYK